MPNYTQTRTLLANAQDGADAVKSTIDRVVNLSNSYKVKVRLNVRNGQVTTRLIGQNLNANQMPPAVVIQYGRLLAKVKRWMNDEEPDFPTL